MTLFNSLIPNFNRSTSGNERPATEPAEPSVKPLDEARETEEAWGLTVQLPGVSKENLELTVDEAQIRIVGRPAWKQPSDWSLLYRETAGAPYELVIDHDNLVDAEKIHAELKDGVLRVSLPKTAAIKPRKIAVN